jgi:hypothetical protein
MGPGKDLSESKSVAGDSPETCCLADLEAGPPDPWAIRADTAIETPGSECITAEVVPFCPDSEEKPEVEQPRQGSPYSECSVLGAPIKRKSPEDSTPPVKRRRVQLNAVEVNLSEDGPVYHFAKDKRSWLLANAGEPRRVSLKDLQETSQIGVQVFGEQVDTTQTIYLQLDERAKQCKWRGKDGRGRCLGMARVALEQLLKTPCDGPFEGRILSGNVP